MAEQLQLDEDEEFYISPNDHDSSMDVEQPPQINYQSNTKTIEKIVNQKVQPMISQIANFQKIMMDANMNDEAIQRINNNPTMGYFNHKKFQNKNYIKARHLQAHLNSELAAINGKMGVMKDNIEYNNKVNISSNQKMTNKLDQYQRTTQNKLWNIQDELNNVNGTIDDMNENMSISENQYRFKVQDNSLQIDEIKEDLKLLKEKQNATNYKK